MNILLTNDDGINSEGLKKLENVLKEYGKVFVVAPMVEQSGKACSINSFKGIKVKKIDKNHIAVDGSPVDCVEVGI
ncbi:5'/3'-nucleotidase SurE, partial [bacterium]|nr:5'/3'-nucleotidase SurE [bacterium]